MVDYEDSIPQNLRRYTVDMTLACLLEDDEPIVRIGAVRALGRISEKQAVAYLNQALEDNHSAVSKNALEALGTSGAQAIPHLMTALHSRSVGPLARESLVRIGEQAFPSLVKALDDEDSYVRRNVVQILGEIGDSYTIPYLVKALHDEDDMVRRLATVALGAMKNPSATPYLGDAIRDGDRYVRINAVKALGRIGGNEAVVFLEKALEDKDDRVREIAREALGVSSNTSGNRAGKSGKARRRKILW